MASDFSVFEDMAIGQLVEALVPYKLQEMFGQAEIIRKPGTGASHMLAGGELFLVKTRRIGPDESFSLSIEPKAVQRARDKAKELEADLALIFGYVDARRDKGNEKEVVLVILPAAAIAKLKANGSSTLTESDAGKIRLSMQVGALQEIERAGGTVFTTDLP